MHAEWASGDEAGFMEMLLYLGVLTAVTLASVAVGTVFRRRAQRRSAAEELPRLVALARRPGRELVAQSDPSAREPFVVVDLQGYRVRFTRRGAVDEDGSRVAEVTVPLPGAKAVPYLYLRTLGWDQWDDPTDARPPLGLKPLELHEPWQGMWVKELRAEAGALPLLSSPTFLVGVRELVEMFAWPGACVAVSGGAVRVCRWCRLKDDAALERLVLVAARVVDAVRALLVAPVVEPVSSEGVEVLPPGDEVPGEVICAVCGVAVGNEGVPCPSCGVPQHRDCWEYFGACATYACPGRTGLRRPG